MTDEFQNQVKNSWSICRKIWSQCGETCFSLGQNRSCSTILWVGLRILNFGRGGGCSMSKMTLSSKEQNIFSNTI